MKARPLICAGLTAVLLGAPAMVHAEHDEQTQVMYGFDRESGKLMRHVVGSGESTSPGTVLTSDGTVLTGIDGAAYAPGFQQIFAFWTEPETMRGRFAYVDVHDATASLAEQPVEGGRVTGAVAVAEGEDQWAVYAIQLAETTPPRPISGEVRLNPNNSSQMQFDLVEIDENGDFKRHWTRSDLLNAQGSDLDGNGNLIKGAAASFRIRPIGQGGQRDVQLGDETITLRNSNTYTFTSGEVSPMKVRVYNAKSSGNGNLPMGHWYLAIEDGTAYNGEEAEVVTPRRLVRVTHKDEIEINDVTGEAHDMPTGTVTELFAVSRDYDGLASLDGEIFYATSGSKLYRLDANNQTENEVASFPIANVFGLAFSGEQIKGFETSNDRVGTYNASTQQFDGLHTVAGMRKLGAIVFCGHKKDPNAQRETSLAAFD